MKLVVIISHAQICLFMDPGNLSLSQLHGSSQREDIEGSNGQGPYRSHPQSSAAHATKEQTACSKYYTWSKFVIPLRNSNCFFRLTLCYRTITPIITCSLGAGEGSETENICRQWAPLWGSAYRTVWNASSTSSRNAASCKKGSDSSTEEGWAATARWEWLKERQKQGANCRSCCMKARSLPSWAPSSHLMMKSSSFYDFHFSPRLWSDCYVRGYQLSRFFGLSTSRKSFLHPGFHVSTWRDFGGVSVTPDCVADKQKRVKMSIKNCKLFRF